MIDAAAISEIVATYKKHDWIPRRVLLSPSLRSRLGEGSFDVFGGVPIIDSDIDGVWFSRPPKQGGVAWELRHLSDTPFALLERVDESSGDFEDRLQAVESRLREAVRDRKPA
jgi:hypothetical protein